MKIRNSQSDLIYCVLPQKVTDVVEVVPWPCDLSRGPEGLEAGAFDQIVEEIRPEEADIGVALAEVARVVPELGLGTHQQGDPLLGVVLDHINDKESV